MKSFNKCLFYFILILISVLVSGFMSLLALWPLLVAIYTDNNWWCLGLIPSTAFVVAVFEMFDKWSSSRLRP